MEVPLTLDPHGWEQGSEEKGLTVTFLHEAATTKHAKKTVIFMTVLERGKEGGGSGGDGSEERREGG